jgi:hypothetical protein
MSVVQSEVVSCPHCGTEQIQRVAQSINAERSPHYRDQILAGEFQRPTCTQCSESFELSQPFIYVDLPRRHWFGVFSGADESGWREWEEAPQRALDVARSAPAGEGVVGDPRVRCVFGLSALREKLLLDDAGLDDVAVEIMKFCLVTSADPAAQQLITEDRSLRIVTISETHFELISFVVDPEAEATLLSVPREVYDEIVAEPKRWRDLRTFLTSGPYVDAGRVFVGGTRRI